MQDSQIINLTWSFRVHGDTNIQNVDLWPELCQQERMRHSTRKKEITNTEDKAISLDDSEYPELGDRIGRNENLLMVEKFCSTDQAIKNFVPNQMNMEPRISKTEKRCRRTDKICINLREVLENTRCSKKINAKDLSKVKVNIYKICQSANGSNTISKCKSPDMRKIKVFISKSKRTSKMKKIIILNRDMKAQINIRKREIFELEKVDAISRDVDAINFNALKITADPELDVDYVKRMSALTFYGKEFRDQKEDNDSNSSVHHRLDVIEKFNDLHIQRNLMSNKFSESQGQACHPYDDLLMDSTLLEQTQSLDIDDDNKEDIKPIIASENNNPLNYSKNFRE